MMDLILGFANEDERVRAVYMNGSRTNANVPKDIYQDFDIVYVVTETLSFVENPPWERIFGKIAVAQEPDRMDLMARKGEFDFSRSYAWLMLFEDGNRIDLTIQIREEAKECYLADKLTVLLLDKDGFLPQLPPPTDIDYHVQRPDAGGFAACCNEFWWCLNNVAKGIVRDELPYAMEMFQHYVRDMLNRMVEWQIGIHTDFSVSAGKMGKFYKKLLPEELYRLYAATYSGSNYEDFWAAVFSACELFRLAGHEVADRLGFPYNEEEDANMSAYLRRMQGREFEKESLP